MAWRRYLGGVEFRDYYTTMGVPRTASEKEIRARYRKLARELHPDVNKDPKATERFKRVNEAYEVLKDPEKKAKYDQLGADWEQMERAQASRPPRPPQAARSSSSQGAHFSGFSDFFETFFGGRGNEPDPLVDLELERLRREQQAPRRGQDSEYTVEVTLAEAVAGGDRNLQVSTSEACPTCHGTGRVSEPGSGGGTAVKVELKTCPACSGAGRQSRQRSLRVTIPKGVTEGSRIRVSGEGAVGANQGPRGDLYLRVKLHLEPGVEVKGRDVHMVLPVRDYRAALGGRLQALAPTGMLEVTIPPGCPAGRMLRVAGKGIPALRDGGKSGDLYLRVRVATAGELKEAERNAYLELARADGQTG
ncbi:MAG: DnaJ C-terminal domain-containing protein [Candidatus Dormibacteria bacterium]|jgi:DnaJ-class molecular chaperone